MAFKDKFGSFKDILGVGATEDDVALDELHIEEKKVETTEDKKIIKPKNDKNLNSGLKTEFIASDSSTNDEKANEPTFEDIIDKRQEPNIELSHNQSIFVTPQSFSECKTIANYIKEDMTVTINLEELDILIAQRIIDFLSGAMSIKGANMIPVSKRVYVAVPKGIPVVFEGKRDSNESEFRNNLIVD